MLISINVDRDLGLALAGKARREGKAIGQFVGHMQGRTLDRHPDAPLGSPPPAARHGLHPLPSRGGWVPNELIDALRRRGEC